MKVPGIKNDERYKALVCLRCGEVYFRRLDANGDKYEVKPTDWGCHCETGDLCPECEKEYRIRLKAFMSRTDEVGIDESKTI